MSSTTANYFIFTCGICTVVHKLIDLATCQVFVNGLIGSRSLSCCDWPAGQQAADTCPGEQFGECGDMN